MKAWIWAAALAAFVAACAPAAQETEQMSAGCDARAASQWTAGGQTFSVEATSVGPDCERAVATLVIRDSSGAPAFAEAYFAADVMVLAGSENTAAMQTALAEWVATSNQQYPTSSALPDWPENAESPVSGEFPFYPADGVDRAAYLDARSRNVPMFCYVQGMESLNCLALEAGGIAALGVQTFPG